MVLKSEIRSLGSIYDLAKAIVVAFVAAVDGASAEPGKEPVVDTLLADDAACEGEDGDGDKELDLSQRSGKRMVPGVRCQFQRGWQYSFQQRWTQTRHTFNLNLGSELTGIFEF